MSLQEDLKAYNNAQRLVTKAKWCMAGAAILTVFVAIDADTLSTWVVTATSIFMTASLWQAGNTVWSLYELAKVQREHIDTLERIIQKGITG